MFDSRIFSEEEIKNITYSKKIEPGPDETVYSVEQEGYDPRLGLTFHIDYLIRDKILFIIKEEVKRYGIVIKRSE